MGRVWQGSSAAKSMCSMCEFMAIFSPYFFLRLPANVSAEEKTAVEWREGGGGGWGAEGRQTMRMSRISAHTLQRLVRTCSESESKSLAKSLQL